jgi:hypothetical protein
LVFYWKVLEEDDGDDSFFLWKSFDFFKTLFKSSSVSTFEFFETPSSNNLLVQEESVDDEISVSSGEKTKTLFLFESQEVTSFLTSWVKQGVLTLYSSKAIVTSSGNAFLPLPYVTSQYCSYDDHSSSLEPWMRMRVTSPDSFCLVIEQEEHSLKKCWFFAFFPSRAWLTLYSLPVTKYTVVFMDENEMKPFGNSIPPHYAFVLMRWWCLLVTFACFEIMTVIMMMVMVGFILN